MGELLLSTIVISVDDKKLGIKLKQARLEKGLSQEEVANKLGLTWEMVSRYENGRSSAVKHLDKLTKIYKKPITFFIGDEDKRETFKIADIVKQLKEEGIGYTATKKNVIKLLSKFSGKGLDDDINSTDNLHEITSSLAEKYENLFAININNLISFDKKLNFNDGDVLIFVKNGKAVKGNIVVGYDGINYEIALHTDKSQLMPLAVLVSMERKFK
jgi:transcriptional regulator with XRE-family HTH domain